jgi:hypothetical protein
VNAGVVGAYLVLGTALANQVSFTDATADAALAYLYKVIAYNAAGEVSSDPLLVNPITPTAMSISAPAINYPQNGVVTVAVTSTAGIVGGNVTLVVDAGAPVSMALSGGVAVFTLTTPAVGNPTLAADYAAQGTFGASNATGVLVVNGAGVTITASSASIPYGSAVPAITPTAVGLISPDTIG